MVDNRRSLFVIPATPPVRPPSTVSRAYGPTLANQSLTYKDNNVMNRISQAKQGWDMLPDQAKSSIVSGIKETGNRIFKSSGDGDSPNSSGYSLTNAPNPKAIQLDTGIRPKTYTSDFLDAVENECSPLHVTHAKFAFPSNAGQKLFKFFTSVSAFELQVNAQNNISYNIDTTTAFSSAAILGAMNVITNAFQIYFYYSSIISYRSDPSNQNAGMLAIRSQFTPAMIEDLDQLGRTLAFTPIPPKLYDLLRYLSGNFLSGNTAESPLLLLSPLTPNETGVDASAISTAITQMEGASVRAVCTQLRKAVPQWAPMVLHDVEPRPFFDRNFLTIFQNMPFTYFKTATFSRVPTVTTETTPIKYNTYTSDLDGTAFALTGMYNSATTLWTPALMTPTGTSGAVTGNSRTSYYTVGGVTKFYPTDLDPYLSRSRSATYQVNDAFTLLVTPHVLGTNMCVGVTPDSVRETSMNVIDYLMSPETIKMDVRNFHFPKGSNKDGKGKK